MKQESKSTVLDEPSYLTVGDVAKILGVTPDRVRDIDQAGKLKSTRTAGGIRLFTREEVIRLKSERDGLSK